ncbi:MAG: helix-turn-helix domain-containing protein [Actinomycetota bacterium]
MTHDQLYDAFGAYVRSQRELAQLTLRQAAELASISNPYLSQIEHGLALPSIAVLSALAEALSVSAETMLLRAAGIAPLGSQGPSNQTEDSIRQDARLDFSQKRALLAVLASFVGSSPEPVSGDSTESSDPVRLVAHNGTPKRTSARPAVAARAASHRRKGV